MAIKRLSSVQLNDITCIFEQDTDNKKVGFSIVPSDMEDQIVTDKKFYRVNNMVQLKIMGDIYPGSYGNGQTMHNSGSVDLMIYESQEVINTKNRIEIHTYFKDDRGYKIENIITYYNGDESFEMKNIFTNESAEQTTLEMLSSFELGNLSPMFEGDGAGSLYAHRILSKWSHEGRLVTERIEDMQLEPSWSTWSVAVERFGQRGSMPVIKYFPFVAVEDKTSGVIWGIQLAHEASWQMEIYRQDDSLHLSGGLADREFGHWLKNVAPGESFETPTAIISTCRGDIDDICHRLVSAGHKYVNAGPSSEQDMPIIFNEYCTTWGNPSHENICGILDAIKDKGFDYFVIDCGWFKEDGIPWDISMGDYNISETLFPEGLDKTVKKIQENGMKPGIWFEIDNVGKAAKAYQLEDHLLKRDGYVLTTHNRRFWNMTDPWVKEYLHNKVIGTLKKYGFEYMKMDYNDTIGLGCDGAESLGEGLRQNMEASVNFIRQVKEEIPGIILENCASGGHKLEPLLMSLCSMASFSDAHENEEIPIIAANLHRTILPRQSQIWAVIRKSDSLKRISYSIANTFLGRMCLSGDVINLSNEQWDVIERGMDFYRKVSSIIRDGKSYRRGPAILSDRHPEGYQIMIRTKKDGETLVLIHCFNGELPSEITVELPESCGTNIVSTYSHDVPAIRMDGNTLVYKPTENMNAVAVYLK